MICLTRSGDRGRRGTLSYHLDVVQHSAVLMQIEK